jgi:phospholipid/cholesterol/gamma-HCH transport system substrate-binding protein
VTVGRVTGIHFDSDIHKAVVTLAMESRYPFSTDSSMSILTSGLLGEQYIGIETGADDETLGDGDLVWLTSSAIVLENLIGQVLVNRVQESGNTK